jgi:hypothetical protein
MTAGKYEAWNEEDIATLQQMASERQHLIHIARRSAALAEAWVARPSPQ